MPVGRGAEQFVARLRTLPLNDAAEYLEMAARLLRIKAHMLLPRHEGDEAWEDPRAELVRRLLEYQQMREVVYVLEKLGEDRRNRFARSYSPELTAPPQAPLALSLVELLVAVDRVLRAARKPTLHEVVPRALDVDGAILTIRAVLVLRNRARCSRRASTASSSWSRAEDGRSSRAPNTRRRSSARAWRSGRSGSRARRSRRSRSLRTASRSAAPKLRTSAASMQARFSNRCSNVVLLKSWRAARASAVRCSTEPRRCFSSSLPCGTSKSCRASTSSRSRSAANRSRCEQSLKAAKPATPAKAAAPDMRIHRALARAGIASRRKAED